MEMEFQMTKMMTMIMMEFQMMTKVLEIPMVMEFPIT
jgi:hypothetical protein